MTPGFGKPRSQLPWLPYEEQDRVIINSHNFTPAIWTPAQISTSLWLDASDAATLFDAVSGGSLVAADGAVARWQDKSGNARHVTQAASGSRALRKTAVQNGLDVLRMDGSNDFFTADSGLFRNKSHVCMFAVVIEKDSTERTVLYASTASAGSTRSTMNASTTTQNCGGRRLDADSFRNTGGSGSTGCNILMGQWNYSGNALSQFRNSAANGTGNTFSSGAGTSQDTASAVCELGRGFSGNSNHDWCEVIIVESPSTETRQRIEGYTAHRWGVAAKLPADHPYKLVAP
jgi:hypothetical protein